MTFIIGLCGPNRVGKTTTAREMARLLNRDEDVACVDAVANPLYESLSAMLGCDESWIKRYKDSPVPQDHDVPSLRGKIMRDALKRLGTEFGRDVFGPNIWADLALGRAHASWAYYTIFDDIRFENEANICDFVIELKRTGIDYGRDHASSFRLPDAMIDAIVDMDGLAPTQVAARSLIAAGFVS